jgi:hypothetical protein
VKLHEHTFCNVADLGAVNGYYFVISNVSEQLCVLISNVSEQLCVLISNVSEQLCVLISNVSEQLCVLISNPLTAPKSATLQKVCSCNFTAFPHFELYSGYI